MDEFKDTKAPFVQFSLRFMVIALLLFAAFWGVAVTVYVKLSMHEQLKQALIDRKKVECLVLLYLENHPGEWPRSWDDLWNNHPKYHPGQFTPSAITDMIAFDKNLEKHVFVDFNLTLEEVANQTPSNFTAIQTANPNWRDQQPEFIDEFLRYVRASQKKSHEPPGPEPQ